MFLFIQVEDGQPINHPATAVNLVQALGDIPPNWEPFVRVERPTVGVYQVLESETPTYEKRNGSWTDVWPVRDMTPEEKAAKQRQVQTAWAKRPQAENWATWIFDEVTCTYLPPVPRPETNTDTPMLWCGAENNWREAPAYPQDGKMYAFNFTAWAWVEVQPPQVKAENV